MHTSGIYITIARESTIMQKYTEFVAKYFVIFQFYVILLCIPCSRGEAR